MTLMRVIIASTAAVAVLPQAARAVRVEPAAAVDATGLEKPDTSSQAETTAAPGGTADAEGKDVDDGDVDVAEGGKPEVESSCCWSCSECDCGSKEVRLGCFKRDVT
jgi:hypothetical protein